MPDKALTQDNASIITARQADFFWRDDLICQLAFQHAVLMHTALVCKRIGTHDRLCCIPKIGVLTGRTASPSPAGAVGSRLFGKECICAQALLLVGNDMGL